MVRAYKSLNAEKEALQATVVALTDQKAPGQFPFCRSFFLADAEVFSLPLERDGQ